MEQRITSPTQEKWLLKLLGYDYEIDYRYGTQNAGSDALSRKPELLAIMGLSTPIFDSVSQIKADCLNDTEAMNIIIQALQAQKLLLNHSFLGRTIASFTKTKYIFPLLQSGGTRSWRSIFSVYKYTNVVYSLNYYQGLLKRLNITKVSKDDLSVNFSTFTPN